MRAIDADAFKDYIRGACEDMKHLYKDNGAWAKEITESFCKDIDEQPTIQPEPHWIPVTERLPETTDAILTTFIVNGDRSYRYVEESSYYGNDGSWCSPWDEYREAGTSIEVIAWMPLPEPYKGVTE